MNIKNIFSKANAQLGAIALGAGALFAGIATHAGTPDTDLVSALASTSGMVSDNKGTIMTFFVAVGLVVLVLAIAKGGLNWAIAKVAGIFGKKKRR